MLSSQLPAAKVVQPLAVVKTFNQAKLELSDEMLGTQSTSNNVISSKIQSEEDLIIRNSPKMHQFQNQTRNVNRSKGSSKSRHKNLINRPIALDKELKLQLYREKKRQLEVKLRQHLERNG